MKDSQGRRKMPLFLWPTQPSGLLAVVPVFPSPVLFPLSYLAKPCPVLLLCSQRIPSR